MRLAVFSDIHGNLQAFDAMIEDLNSVGEVDLIWCLGDFAAWGTRPAACVTKLRELHEQYGKDKFKIIGGNTDRYLVTGKRPEGRSAKDEEGFTKRQRMFMMRDAMLNWALDQFSWDDYEFVAKTVGRELYTRVDGYGDLIGYHAIPGDDDSQSLNPHIPDEEAEDALLDRSGRMAIGGHTHKVMDRALGAWRVVNPGSVGLSFTAPNFAEWALIDFTDDDAAIDFRKVPYDLAAFKADIDAVGYPHPDWLLQFITK